MTDDIAVLSAIESLRLYRAGKLSPVAVIEATPRRLETYEGALNAFVMYDPDTALRMAREWEAPLCAAGAADASVKAKIRSAA